MQAIHPDFEIQVRRLEKSKTGVLVALKKDLCPPKILKKIDKLLGNVVSTWNMIRSVFRIVEVRLSTTDAN